MYALLVLFTPSVVGWSVAISASTLNAGESFDVTWSCSSSTSWVYLLLCNGGACTSASSSSYVDYVSPYRGSNSNNEPRYTLNCGATSTVAFDSPYTYSTSPALATSSTYKVCLNVYSSSTSTCTPWRLP